MASFPFVAGMWIRHRLGEGKILAVEDGGLLAVRFGAWVEWFYGDLDTMEQLDRPADDMTAPFEARRAWYDLHPKVRHGRFTCPCCGYPTLLRRDYYDGCPLCNWDDECLDDETVDKQAGMNSLESLREARRDFDTLGTIYPEDGSAEACADRDPNVKRLAGELRARYECLMKTTDPRELKQAWLDIGMFERYLDMARRGGARQGADEV